MTEDDFNKTWHGIPSLNLEMDTDYEKRLKAKEGRKHDRADFTTLRQLLDRKHPSIPIRVGTAKKGTFDGIILDLSSSGVRVSIPKELDKGERVKIGFIINNRTILANAVARWTSKENNKHTVGLEYHGIASKDREYLGSLSNASLFMKIGSPK